MIKFLIALALAALVLPTSAHAQNCKRLYGGGVTQEQACNGKTPTSVPVKTTAKATPTPTKAKPTPVKSVNQGTTTKGGLPVLSPTPQKTTPSTGPEILGLLALVPAAGLGYYLRKKGNQ